MAKVKPQPVQEQTAVSPLAAAARRKLLQEGREKTRHNALARKAARKEHAAARRGVVAKMLNLKAEADRG